MNTKLLSLIAVMMTAARVAVAQTPPPTENPDGKKEEIKVYTLTDEETGRGLEAALRRSQQLRPARPHLQ
ncbi:MAG: hypothetical protein WDN28_01955 [Chthoniobacter sp.]